MKMPYAQKHMCAKKQIAGMNLTLVKRRYLYLQLYWLAFSMETNRTQVGIDAGRRLYSLKQWLTVGLIEQLVDIGGRQALLCRLCWMGRLLVVARKRATKSNQSRRLTKCNWFAGVGSTNSTCWDVYFSGTIGSSTLLRDTKRTI